MEVRCATPADVEIIVSLRMRLFAETGETLDDDSAGKVEQSTREFFSQNIASSISRTWVATADADQVVVSVGTLAFFTRPPYPGNLSGREAYLLNMYTLPQYRKQGFARKILETAMRFAQQAGCQKVWLHASPAGRTLYESQGFCADSSYLVWASKQSR
jgi:ribosomal protein S18 acetylase RimI-like enzyme